MKLPQTVSWFSYSCTDFRFPFARLSRLYVHMLQEIREIGSPQLFILQMPLGLSRVVQVKFLDNTLSSNVLLRKLEALAAFVVQGLSLRT